MLRSRRVSITHCLLIALLFFVDNLRFEEVIGFYVRFNFLSKLRFDPVFVAETEVTVVKNLLVKADNRNSRDCASSPVLDIKCNDVLRVQVLSRRDHISKDRVLQLRSLDRIENYLAVGRPKVWLERAAEGVVPVFEVWSWP